MTITRSANVLYDTQVMADDHHGDLAFLLQASSTCREPEPGPRHQARWSVRPTTAAPVQARWPWPAAHVAACRLTVRWAGRRDVPVGIPRPQALSWPFRAALAKLRSPATKSRSATLPERGMLHQQSQMRVLIDDPDLAWRTASAGQSDQAQTGCLRPFGQVQRVAAGVRGSLRGSSSARSVDLPEPLSPTMPKHFARDRRWAETLRSCLHRTHRISTHLIDPQSSGLGAG